LHAFPAGKHRCALAKCVADVALDLFDCALVDERSDLRVVLEPVADLHAGSDFRETLREAIVDAALNEYAVRAYAGLPRVSILGGDGARDRGLDIGIVEHDKRRVAAELERELLQRGCTL